MFTIYKQITSNYGYDSGLTRIEAMNAVKVTLEAELACGRSVRPLPGESEGVAVKNLRVKPW